MQKNTNQQQYKSGDVAELEFLRRQQQVVFTLAEAFLRGEERQVLFERVSQLVSDVLQVDGCLVLERVPGEGNFQLYSACGFCDLQSFETTKWINNRQFNATMQEPEIKVVADYNESSHFTPPDKECFRDFRSGMSIRIAGYSEPRGFLAVYHSQPRAFDELEQAFLQTIANMLAGALSRDAKEQALVRSEARSNAILDTAVDGIITIDEDGLITLFNQAAQQIFGYREEEVLGRNVSVLMPEPYRGEHDAYLANYKKTGSKKIIGKGREMTGLRKDGTTFPLYLAVSEFHAGQKRHFTGIVRDITDQRRLEQEVLRISDHERRRIGQDLHDGLGQMLTGIGLMSQSLKSSLEKEQSGAVEQAEEITRLIREADAYAKNLSRGLLPVDFEVRGLVTSLGRLAANAQRLFGVTCTFRESSPPVFYDNSVVEHLFRIAQEAVSNAVKHGMADEILLELTSTKKYAKLRVVDNGKGFAENWQEARGSGLDIMQFRARLIGAGLDLQNLENGGVEVSCLLPRTETVYNTEEEQN